MHTYIDTSRHIHVYILRQIRSHTQHTHTHIDTHIHTILQIYTHTHTYIHTHVCTYTWTHTHTPTHIYMCVWCMYDQMDRVFAIGPGDLGSIPGRVIPKTLKMVLDTALLNTQQYKVLSMVKWRYPGKGGVPSSTPGCSSYWKGRLLVTLDYGRQLYLLYM